MNISSIGLSGSGMSPMSMMNSMRGPQSMKGNSVDFASKIMEQDDADGDGVLSIEETPLSEELFAEIDADGNGLLTTEELQTHHENRPPPPPPPGVMNIDSAEFVSRLMEQDDADGNGVLSIEETPLSEELFAEIDTDGDGLLTTEELQTHHESVQAMREERMASRPPGGPGAPTGSEDSEDSVFAQLMEALNQFDGEMAYQEQAAVSAWLRAGRSPSRALLATSA